MLDLLPRTIWVTLGVTNAFAVWSTIAFGYTIEFGLTYALVYFPTRYLFRHHYEIRAHRTVA